MLIRVYPGGQVYGPYGEGELDAAVEQLLAQFAQEGYQETRLARELSMLGAPDSEIRARTALRLVRKPLTEPECRLVASALLAALPKAVDDSCTLLDALGDLYVSDPDVLEALRAYAARKLLSRRRSAVEALRKLGDNEGLQAVLVHDTPRNLMEQPAPERGRLLDQLYELDDSEGNEIVRQLVQTFPIERKDVWRYVKSVFKRSLLREDNPTFAILALRIERTKTKGTKATVKSGYDGEKRETTIFSPKTRAYLQRLCWRHLTQLDPPQYVDTAARILAGYREEDAREPRGLSGSWADAYLMHQILWGASQRFRLDPWRLRWRFRSSADVQAPAGVREESFRSYWDARPQAYLRLLAEGGTAVVHEFACAAVRERHPDLLTQADAETLSKILLAAYPPTQVLGSQELMRRFDPEKPDWTLVQTMASHPRPELRQSGLSLLERTLALWIEQPERVLGWLEAPDEEFRSRVAELAIPALANLPAVRAQLAPLLWQRLQQPEANPAQARLVRQALLAELQTIATADLCQLLLAGAPSARIVAAALLAQRPEALEVLGVPAVITLAEDELADVRAAAHLLLPESVSIQLILVESRWPDTRQAAFEALKRLDLNYDEVQGLCDSNREDVQSYGKSRMSALLPQMDAGELLGRLSEHPHRNMRSYALELILKHLLEGAMPLEPVLPLFRALFFDMHPSAAEKSKAIDFLVQRGMLEVEQAVLSARLLGELVRSGVRRDADAAVVGLTRLSLQFPELESPLKVRS